MLKNSTWKNMLLRAWKHSLQSFLPLLPPQNPNQQVDFVFRLPPPPTQSLLWNMNSSSGSKKSCWKHLRHFTPSGKCHPRPLGCLESRKVRGVRGRKSYCPLWRNNESERQSRKTCQNMQISLTTLKSLVFERGGGKYGNPNPLPGKEALAWTCGVWVQRSHAVEEC